MTRNLLAVVLFGMVGVAALGVAQSAGQTGSAEATPSTGGRNGPSSTAVLDVVRVFNECAQIKDLNDMIRQKSEEVKQEADQRRKVIEEKQYQLAEAFEPGTRDYEARRKDFMRLNIEANVWLKFAEEDMERQKFDWTRIIYEKAAKVAGELAQQRGYAVVLQRTEFLPAEVGAKVQALRRMIQERTVLYHVSEIDITDEVIRRLDAEYKAERAKKQAGQIGLPTP